MGHRRRGVRRGRRRGRSWPLSAHWSPGTTIRCWTAESRRDCTPPSFPITGIAAAGWALVGFALGVLAGLLWRRVVPAIVTAFAAWFGLAYLAASYRVHYLTPLTTTSLDQSSRDLTISQWWTKGGVRVSDTQINSVLSAVGRS